MAIGLNLAEYLNQGAERLVRDVRRATLFNLKETAFLWRYGRSLKTMLRRRAMHQAQGHPIPMFLIASITNACNLYCKGCYARANGQCGGKSDAPLLTADEWGDVFAQAEAAGVGFILLAGGEPMLRHDVLTVAARHEGILFPIFTNGTMIDPLMLSLLDQHRNLVPVVSLEGGEASTDARRGAGAYRRVQASLVKLSNRRLLFGVSLTVTTENRAEVMSPAFVRSLRQQGCRLVFYIEYVPATPGTESLAPDDAERLIMDHNLEELRASFPGMVFLSFPGDEKHMGGCLAAGRGFFHINAYGSAEPCPFSPYSISNIKNQTLLEVIDSPFFQAVRELNAQDCGHLGGCALFEKEALVKSLLHP
ncbi:MAG: radical SAM protein [Clostridiales bacterium]|nr:radical SAM protein [Clostridiales bacterium]